MNAQTLSALADLDLAVAALRSTLTAPRSRSIDAFCSQMIDALARILPNAGEVSARGIYLHAVMAGYDELLVEETTKAGAWVPPADLAPDELRHFLHVAIQTRMLNRLGLLDGDAEPQARG